MQLSMLVHEALEGRPIYNMPWCVRITGAIDVLLLARALEHVVRRHPVLCARYDAGMAVPVTDPTAPLQTATFADTAAALAAVADLWASPIDVSTGPPLRAMLASVAAGDSYLALSIHHVAGDSWSFLLLADELGRVYAALLRRTAVADEPPAPNFFDYAQEERTRSSDTSFWRLTLGDAQPQPYPRSEPPPDDERCLLHSIDLDLDGYHTRGIRALAREARVSPTAVLFTAVSTAVAGADRHTSTVGLPAVLRDTRRLQATMGPLLNTVPVRTAWLPGSAGATLVQAHAEAIDAALANKDVPYSRIVKAAGVRRRPRTAPLFLHAVNVDTEVSRLRLAGTRCEPIHVPPRWAIFPAMWLFDWGTVGNMRGVLHASRDAFTASQAATCVDRFRVGLDRLLGQQ
jgi:hypothetical protein